MGHAAREEKGYKQSFSTAPISKDRAQIVRKEDVYIAAVGLYLDILNIFWFFFRTLKVVMGKD